MPRVLILYATTEGQTARIVERIAQRLRDKRHTVETHRADAIPAGLDQAAYTAITGFSRNR